MLSDKRCCETRREDFVVVAIEIKQNHYIMEHIKTCLCVCVSKCLKSKWCTKRKEKFFLNNFHIPKPFYYPFGLCVSSFRCWGGGGVKDQWRKRGLCHSRWRRRQCALKNTRKSLKICLKNVFGKFFLLILISNDDKCESRESLQNKCKSTHDSILLNPHTHNFILSSYLFSFYSNFRAICAEIAIFRCWKLKLLFSLRSISKYQMTRSRSWNEVSKWQFFQVKLKAVHFSS